MQIERKAKFSISRHFFNKCRILNDLEKENLEKPDSSRGHTLCLARNIDS